MSFFKPEGPSGLAAGCCRRHPDRIIDSTLLGGGLWQGPGLFNRTCHTCLPATARFGVLESRVATDQQIE
eukprot:symbB.v1.2.026258.t1/scaffold2611.1/size89775/2